MRRQFAGLLIVAGLSGCAVQAPSYQASVESVGVLRSAGIVPLQVSSVTAAPRFEYSHRHYAAGQHDDLVSGRQLCRLPCYGASSGT